jgi:putative tricarboxylic transport membrane protein
MGMEVIGFLLASYIFLAASMYLLGSRRIGLNLLISLLVLAAIFIVFRAAFSVVLPAGSLVGPYLPEFLK